MNKRYLSTPTGAAMAVVDQLAADVRAEGGEVNWRNLAVWLDRDAAVEAACRARVHLDAAAWRLVESTIRTRAATWPKPSSEGEL